VPGSSRVDGGSERLPVQVFRELFLRMVENKYKMTLDEENVLLKANMKAFRAGALGAAGSMGLFYLIARKIQVPKFVMIFSTVGWGLSSMAYFAKRTSDDALDTLVHLGLDSPMSVEARIVLAEIEGPSGAWQRDHHVPSLTDLSSWSSQDGLPSESYDAQDVTYEDGGQQKKSVVPGGSQMGAGDKLEPDWARGIDPKMRIGPRRLPEVGNARHSTNSVLQENDNGLKDLERMSKMVNRGKAATGDDDRLMDFNESIKQPSALDEVREEAQKESNFSDTYTWQESQDTSNDFYSESEYGSDRSQATAEVHLTPSQRRAAERQQRRERARHRAAEFEQHDDDSGTRTF